MTDSLLSNGEPIDVRAFAPLREIGAYEALWDTDQTSFKKLATLFRAHPDALPSDFVDAARAEQYAAQVLERFKSKRLEGVNVRLFGGTEYPVLLRDADHPIELLYYRGLWDLIYAPRRVAVVGTRSPSEDGIKRTKQLVRWLVADEVVIVSGLAKGIDTVAHRTTIEHKGRTIAVLGTPISETYPKENAGLQEEIARDHLLVSQVPVIRYLHQSINGNRLFFPARNVTMSALTEATIIVEAGETSGTLIQAQAAIAQKRKLFILESCFSRKDITWPEKYEAKGAIRVRSYDDIAEHLGYSTAATDADR